MQKYNNTINIIEGTIFQMPNPLVVQQGDKVMSIVKCLEYISNINIFKETKQEETRSKLYKNKMHLKITTCSAIDGVSTCLKFPSRKGFSRNLKALYSRQWIFICSCNIIYLTWNSQQQGYECIVKLKRQLISYLQKKKN